MIFLKMNKNFGRSKNIWKKRLENAINVKNYSSSDILRYIFGSLYIPFLIIHNSLVFFSLDLNKIKFVTKIFPKNVWPEERGENILDILAHIQFRNNGKLPDRIEYFVENYFGGKIYFEALSPGKLNLCFVKQGVKFSKEHLPDGLLKGLAILTALELKPENLLIDEIENSLHPELLEFLINVLKEEAKGYVFITTHSLFFLI